MGRLRLAHKGTLFLTEIGDLSLPLQVKLLTFLDDKIVHPLGSTDGFQADVRIIAATHSDLIQMVKEGTFRQDLLFRLNVVRFHLPPLRERAGDVRLLLDHFLKIFSVRFGKPVKSLSQSAQELLLTYAYPGNVREIRNIVEYATSICPGEIIGLEHLPAYLEETILDVGREGCQESQVLSPTRLESQEKTGDMNWANIERQLIIKTLVKVKGRRGKAAHILGWGRSTLWRKMKQYGLES
jgi:transcriptional regulator with PAS, ATPase and Fis domain